MNHWHLSEHINGGNILYALWSAGLAFLAPIGWWLGACAFFVVSDFITGCWAARRKGEMWKSSKFRDSLYKCASYMFLIICARIFESILPTYVEAAEVARLFSAFICGVELYSIIENLYKGTGNRVFYILTQITNKKLKDTTGFDAKGE